MPFHSATLLAMVAVLAVAYWLVPWQRARLMLLLLASLFIYAFRHPPSVLLLLGSIAFNYAWGLLLERRRTKALLAVGVGLNLFSLFSFKYSGFFASQWRLLVDPIVSTSHGATLSEGVSTASAPWLPLGISFFTFQVVAYLVDVYRGELKAEKSLLVFAVFKSFFAQLVAGPIVRGTEFLPQLRSKRVFDIEQLHTGVRLVVAGLFLKVGIADFVSQHVDDAWQHLDGLETSAAWLVTYGYAAQLLADFCGYSTMAVGFGLCFGLTLPPNFLNPYGAPSLRLFWRRWHVTLSNWLRDYLYLPLGGNRKHAEANRLITMTLGGLWHGAGWTFVAWGFLHGAWLFIEQRLTFLARLPKWVQVLITFHVVALLWVPFRAPSFAAALEFTKHLFAFPFTWRSNVSTPFVLVTALFLVLQKPWFDAFPLGPRPPMKLRYEVPLVLAMVIWLLGYGAAKLDFIYFVF